MTWDALVQWVDNNQLGVGKKIHVKRQLALPAIMDRLTADCRRAAVVLHDNGATYFSIVVASNKTVVDLARTDDLEMIQSVQ
jgi:hypothetical protein